MLTKLKQRIQALIAHEAQLIYKIGVTPNLASALGVLTAIVSAILFASPQFYPWNLVTAPLFLLISGFFDALDGVIARLY